MSALAPCQPFHPSKNLTPLQLGPDLQHAAAFSRRTEAAGTPPHRHYNHTVNYHLIGTQSVLSLLCVAFIGFNNLFSADFIPFIPGSRSLVRQEVDGDRGQRNLAGMQLKRRGRKTHGPTLLKQRGLSCNEERVSRRGRFLFFFFAPAPSFFSSSPKEMW